MSRPRPSATPEMLAAIRSLAELGLRDADIAKSLEIGISSIVRWRERHGLPVGRDVRNPGTAREGVAQLRGEEREAAAASIGKLAAEGLPDREIADRLSLSHRVVGHLRLERGIEPGPRQVALVPVPLPRIAAAETADCPACDTEVGLTAGRLSDHGPCAGSGLPLGATP